MKRDGIEPLKSLDFLTMGSGIAILCVVLIHSHQRYLSVLFGKSVPVWYELPFTDALYEHIVIFAVGLFVLIAGFKFELTRNITNISEYVCFLKARIQRIIRPFWWLTTIFLVGGTIIQLLGLAKKMDEVSLLHFIEMYLLRLSGEEPHPTHLWYIPMLVFVSFLYPIFRNLISNHLLRLGIFISASILIVLGEMNTYPFYWVRFFIVYEIGTMFCRRYKKKGMKFFEDKIRYFFYVVFVLLFLFRKENADIQMEFWLSQLLWIVGPVVYFYLSGFISERCLSNMLMWLGKYSWPIYLFHEPYFVIASYGLMKKVHLGDSYWAVIFSTIIPMLLSVFFYKKIKDRKLGRYIV